MMKLMAPYIVFYALYNYLKPVWLEEGRNSTKSELPTKVLRVSKHDKLHRHIFLSRLQGRKPDLHGTKKRFQKVIGPLAQGVVDLN